MESLPGAAFAAPLFPALGFALAFALLAAPAAAAPPSIEPVDVDQAIALARELDATKDVPIPPDGTWFRELAGSVKVIVTAPHATRPLRNGVRRFSDGGGTGALAAALHRLCGVTALYTSADSPADPNQGSNDNAFKQRLGALIDGRAPVLVLDIHGSHPFRPYDVDLGTMNGRSVEQDATMLPQLRTALRGAGFGNLSQDRFPANGAGTITRFAHARGVTAVQLEFSATRIEPQAGRLNGHLFAQALEALVVFLDGRGLCAGPAAHAADDTP